MKEVWFIPHLRRITRVKVTDIQVHPRNEEIYGQDRPDEMEDLVRSIDQNGLFEPLVITKNNVLLSGHRRLTAIKQLGWTEVDVRVIEPENEIIALVSFNKYRSKSDRVSAREVAAVAEQLRSTIGRGRSASANRGGKKLTLASEVSRLTGVGQQQAKQLMSLQRNAPDLVEKVERQELSPNAAYKQMRKRLEPREDLERALRHPSSRQSVDPFAMGFLKLLKQHQPSLDRINELVRMTYPYCLQTTGITELQRDELLSQLQFLSGLDSRSSMLVHKQDELEHHSLSKTEVKRCKSLIPTFDEVETWWSKIVSSRVKSSVSNPLSEIEIISTDDDVEGWDSKLWTNFRLRISNGVFSVGPGRDMRFFVTVMMNKKRKLLGIVQLHSDAQQMNARDEHIGWSSDQRAKNREHVVNMMTCVATQPLGHNRLGVKLLCCLIPRMVERWNTKYEQRVVAVFTTSLHGQESVYQGMKPRWNGIGVTSGAMLIKPLSDEMSFWNGWLNEHFTDAVDKTKSQSSPLQAKLKLLYRILGFNESELTHTHKRGSFVCHLYDNWKEFLRDEDTEDQLIPFDRPWEEWWMKKARTRMETLQKKDNVLKDQFFIEDMSDVDYWLHLNGY